MILNVYAIYDTQAKAFAQPFYMTNDGQAIRAFTDNINSSEESMLSKHPEHFSLYEIGRYDDAKGQLDSMDPRLVIAGREVVLPKKEDDMMKEIKSIKAMIGQMSRSDLKEWMAEPKGKVVYEESFIDKVENQ